VGDVVTQVSYGLVSVRLERRGNRHTAQAGIALLVCTFAITAPCRRKRYAKLRTDFMLHSVLPGRREFS
jgi:hypothetical protein